MYFLQRFETIVCGKEIKKNICLMCYCWHLLAQTNEIVNILNYLRSCGQYNQMKYPKSNTLRNRNQYILYWTILTSLWFTSTKDKMNCEYFFLNRNISSSLKIVRERIFEIGWKNSNSKIFLIKKDVLITKNLQKQVI